MTSTASRPSMRTDGLALAAYLSGVIGQPWSARENCWTLTARIQRDYFGRRLPLVRLPKTAEERHETFHSRPERAAWRQVSEPQHGAVVLMSAVESPRRDEHAGVCVVFDWPLIVHVDDPHGVVADDIMTARARGWSLSYWMPV